MDKEKETMAGEQTVQPQEVENGTENKTVRKSISWVRILIATLFILLTGGVIGAIWIHYYITKMFTMKTEPKQEVTERPEPQMTGNVLPRSRGIAEPETETIYTEEGCIDER